MDDPRLHHHHHHVIDQNSDRSTHILPFLTTLYNEPFFEVKNATGTGRTASLMPWGHFDLASLALLPFRHLSFSSSGAMALSLIPSLWLLALALTGSFAIKAGAKAVVTPKRQKNN